MASVAPYDAILLVSFGGPEGPDDVLPFLANVTGGREIPPERLAEVAGHYLRFGGVSPINTQNRALLAALRAELTGADVDVALYWGNRNFTPYLRDTVAAMARAGVRRALCVLTSAYASYPGCRQYREDLAAALVAAGATGLRMDRLRHYYDAPGFIEPQARGLADALARLPAGSRTVFVTHSLPTALAETSGPPQARGAYVRQHLEVARLVAQRAGASGWDLAFCSRSGPPHQPWLEPDINDHLEKLAAARVPGVAVAPIGFVSDHMEVRYDLDTEAAATAGRLGLGYERVPTVGTAGAFVTSLVERILERAATERGEPVTRQALGTLGPAPDTCPAGCCPNPRGPRPAVGGED